MLPLLVLLGTIAGAWYLLIVRPQKDQQTRHGRLVERLQVGDHVLTVGGIYGRVAAVEATSVVLELAPGLTSRIATDGIARIVHDAEAAMPIHETGHASPARPANDQVTVPNMHPHDEHPQQQPAHLQPGQHGTHPQLQPAWAAAPPMPVMPAPAPHSTPVYAAPMPTAMPTASAPSELPAPPPPYGTTTFRAQVLPALPTYEPRPWGDVAPVPAATHAAATPRMFAPNLPPPPRLFAPSIAAQPAPIAAPHPQPPQASHAHVPQFAASQAMPVHAPFPLQPPPAFHPAPLTQSQQQAPMHLPLQPAHVQPAAGFASPGVAPMHAPAIEQAPPHEDAAAARKTSRAPQGMGSSLRLDDPSIRDTMMRAREERTDLAAEYGRTTGPLVDIGSDTPAAPAPQLGGHDPSGVPLFATPGATGVHPIAQYPAPMHPPAGMPRPVVTQVPGPVDPALRPNAFQRPAPYTPHPQPPAAQQASAALA